MAPLQPRLRVFLVAFMLLSSSAFTATSSASFLAPSRATQAQSATTSLPLMPPRGGGHSSATALPLIPPRPSRDGSLRPLAASPASPPPEGSPEGSPPPRTAKSTLAKLSFLLLPLSLVCALQSPPLKLLPALSPADLRGDVLLTLLCSVLATAWLKAVTALAVSGRIAASDARKIIHTGSAPFFMLLWPFFSAAGETSQLLAACVPLANLLKLAGAGLSGDGKGGGDREASDLAKAVSRSGQPREAFGGPFIYTIVLLAATGLFFTSSPVGVVGVAQMAAGDGLADIVGRRLGKTGKWWFDKDKSYAGSAAFFVAAFGASWGLLEWLGYWGALVLDESVTQGGGLPLRLAAISLVCMIVEVLPGDWIDDNWSVPVAGALLAQALLVVN